jgi:hypothetical protein
MGLSRSADFAAAIQSKWREGGEKIPEVPEAKLNALVYVIDHFSQGSARMFRMRMDRPTIGPNIT